MKETYFKWMGRDSKMMGLVCEAITVSPPEQKIKVMELSNTDNSYNYTENNYRFRPLFNNRIITVSSYLKFNDVDEKIRRVSEITNWLFSWTYQGYLKDLEILPDYEGVLWSNVSIESFQQIDVVSMHTVKLIFQFRADCFSKNKENETVDVGYFNFFNFPWPASTEEGSTESATNKAIKSRDVHVTPIPGNTPVTPIPGGKTLQISFDNVGYYTNDFSIGFEGACNWIEIYNFNNDKSNAIQLKDGFQISAFIDFKNKVAGVTNIDENGNHVNLSYYPDTDYYELQPRNNIIYIRSDGSFRIKFYITTRHLYGKEFPDLKCSAEAEFVTES